MQGLTNKTTVDNIKNLLTNCGSLTQHMLTINAILKDPIYSEQSGQVNIINTEQDCLTIIEILHKIDNRNDEIVTSDVNTRRRVRARRRLISKSSSEYSIDQVAFSFSVDDKTNISDSAARTVKSRTNNNIIASVLNVATHKNKL